MSKPEFVYVSYIQVVLEADPPRRLSYTWHAITPEWNPKLSKGRSWCQA